MQKWNLYSRGDKFFAIVVSVLIGMFTVATLYPFIYIAAVSFSSGFAAAAGKVVLTPIDATLEALMALREVGKIRYFGLCNYNPRELQEALDYKPEGLVSLQTPYSMLRREFEYSLRDLAAPGGEQRLGVLAYEVLCRGLLTGKFTHRPSFPASVWCAAGR